MQKIGLIWIASALAACQHAAWPLDKPQAKVPPLPEPTESSCLSSMVELEGLSMKELKSEYEKLLKLPADRKADSDVRSNLLTALYFSKNHNYTKAVDALSPLTNRKSLDDVCLSSIRIYNDLIEDLAQVERDLVSEKKQKGELERKLRALSEIEKEISQRDLKNQGL